MIQTQKRTNHLERSREVILNLGYDFIVFKSKINKGVTAVREKISKKNKS
jgi:hypothetical protein